MRTSIKQADRATSPGTPRWEVYETPFGRGRVLVHADLPLQVELPGTGVTGSPSASPGRWAESLRRYFDGEPVSFGLDVAACADVLGFTGFERAVYAALSRVPYGTVVSYRDLATAAGRPNAYRAVGSAMARNSLPVILPCHRVVRNDGRLGDYGDDPSWKERLLKLEGIVVQERRLV